VALHVEVFIGATAEEMRFFAVIDPTFRWLGCLLQLRTGIARLLVRARSHHVYQGPARTFAWRHARSGGWAYKFRVSYQPPGSTFGMV